MRNWLCCLCVLLLLGGTAVEAQEWRSEALSSVDLAYMSQQRDTIDTLARTKLGMQVNGAVDNDLRLLQRLLDEGAVPAEDVATLQAMGIVLGDLLKSHHGLLWTIYEDRQGRSRALEIPGHKEFLFPVTMISRRAEVGAKVNVRELWDRAGEIVAEVRGPSPW